MSRLSLDDINLLLENPDALSDQELGVIENQLSSYQATDPSELRQRKQARVDSYFESPDNIGSDFDEKTKQRYDILAKRTGEETKLRDANALYFSHVYSNVTPEQFYANEQGYYRERFGEEEISTSEAYQRIQGEVSQNKLKRKFDEDFYGAFEGKILDYISQGQNIEQMPEHGVIVNEILESMSDHEGFMPEYTDTYYENSFPMFLAAADRYGSVIDQANRTNEILSQLKGVTEPTDTTAQDFSNLVKELAALPEEDLQAVKRVLYLQSQQANQEDDKGVLEKTGTLFGRGVISTSMSHVYGQSIRELDNREAELKAMPTESLEDGFVQYKQGDIQGLTQDQKNKMLSDIAKEKREIFLERDLIDIANGVIDPVKTDGARGYWYKFVEQLPFMAQATIPAFGLPLTVSTEYDSSYREYKQENPNLADDEIHKMSVISSMGKGLIENFQAKLLLGQGSKILKFANNPSSYKSFTREFLQQSGVNIIAQNAQEAVQDLVDPMVQFTFSQFSDEIPEPDLEAVKEQFIGSRYETFQGLLIPSLIGAGVGSFRNKVDAEAFLSDVNGLKAMGIPQTKAEEIAINNKGKTIEEREAAYQEAYKERDLNLAKEFTRKRDVAMENEVIQNDSSELSTIDMMEDQQGNRTHTVKSPEGKVLANTKSYDQALKVAVEHDTKVANERDFNQGSVLDMVDHFNSLNSNQKIEVSDQQRTMQDEINEGLDPEVAYERIKIAGMARGENYSDYKPEDIAIFGRNVEEFKNNSYTYTSYIYKGANPTAVVEELTEGYVKENLNKIAGFETDLKQWKKEYEEFTGQVTHNNDTASLIEWFSDRAIDYSINESLEGDQLPPSFRTFLEKMKAFMRDIIGRASKLAEMKREGKLSEGFEMELAESLGIDMSGTEAAQKTAQKRANRVVAEGGSNITEATKEKYKQRVDSAQKTSDKLKERSSYKRAKEGKFFDSKVMNSPKVKQGLYNQVNNKTYIDDAIAYIEKKGADDALRHFESGFDETGRELDPVERVSLGIVLIEHFNQTKQYENAALAFSRVTELGTTSGQVINMFKHLGNAFKAKGTAMAYAEQQFTKAKKNPKEREEVSSAISLAKEIAKDVQQITEPKQGEGTTFQIEPKDPSTTFMAQPKTTAKTLKSRFTRKYKYTQNSKIKGALDNVFSRIEAGEVVTPTQIDKAFEEAYRVPEFDSKLRQKYSDLFDKIDKAPEDSQLRDDLTQDFLRQIMVDLDQVDVVDVGMSLWFGSMLGGMFTAFRNVIESFNNTTLDNLFLSISLNPLKAHHSLSDLMTVMGVQAKGYVMGAREAWYHIRTGGTVTGASEAGKFFPNKVATEVKLKTILGIPVNEKFNPWNWRMIVSRVMNGGDALLFKPAQDALMTLKAKQMARDQGLSGADAVGYINDVLSKNPERMADFEARAKQEWDEGVKDIYKLSENNWIKRRTKELQEQSADGQLYEQATDLANRSVFRYTPEGVLGMFAAGINFSKKRLENSEYSDNKFLKLLAYAPTFQFPFVNIVANSINQKLDYTGLGIARGLVPVKVVAGAEGKKIQRKTKDEQAMEIKKGAIGVAFMAYLLNRDPDDEEAVFQIHGAGTGDYYKDNALRQNTGWMPYSIEFKLNGKSHYISYRYTPVGLLFNAVGSMHDIRRYHKDWEEKDLYTTFAWSMSDASSFIMDDSFLKSVSEITEAMSAKGENKQRAWERVFASKAGSALDTAIPVANFWRQIDRTFLDDYKRYAPDLEARMINRIPFARRLNEPALDWYGDAINEEDFNGLYLGEVEGSEEAIAKRDATQYIIASGASLSNPNSYRYKMEDEQYYNFVKLRGQYIKEMIVNSGFYKKMPDMEDEYIKKYVKKVISAAKKRAFYEVGYDPREEKNK